MKFWCKIVLALLAACLPAVVIAGEPLRVAASINPLYGIAAAVMEGVGKPALIIRAGQSPHNYALRPSDAKSLAEADVFIWIGPELESFLGGKIETLAPKAHRIEIAGAPGLVLHKFRSGEIDDDEDHGQESHDHDEDDEHGHEHGGGDMHVWLDPENAKIIARTIAEKLAAEDTENATVYRANADTFAAKLDELDKDIRALTDPVRQRPYVVFHDAFQYFEKRFDLHPALAIIINPQVPPGAKRIREIQDKIKGVGAACVFSEPQFENRIVQSIAGATGARTAVLDPLGAEIESGPDLYFSLMKNMATSISACLSSSR